MSVTTFGDLVSEAEQVLLALARQREPAAPGLAAGWPAFSRRAVHAITAATGARDPRWYAVDRLIVEVTRPVGRTVVAAADAGVGGDPLLERAGVLLGAAGDLLASAPRDSVADPMLLDANVKAAQSRVGALLAAAAHSSVRALARFDGCPLLARADAREMAETLMRIERLATGVFQSNPTLASRADDVAVLSIQPGSLTLEDAGEVWGWHALDTVRSASPSARDLQAVAADLSRIATHSRVLVAAAVTQNVIDPAHGRAVDATLGRLAAGWLDVAQAWTGLHTAQPPTPAKIAASRALGQALMAVTRDGRDWAAPAVAAERVDVARALGALRRALDVGREVAEAQPQQTTRLADSGLLYAPAALTAPTLERLHARIRGNLVTVGRPDIEPLMRAMSIQQGQVRAGTDLVGGPFVVREARRPPAGLSTTQPSPRPSLE
jgi:hypothetical protein